GDVIISEIMYDPHDDDDQEWIELYNTTGGSLSLEGCVLRDNDSSSRFLVIGDVTLGSGGYGLFVKSDNTAVNTGLTPDDVFEMNLSNGEEVALECSGALIDVVTYDDNDDGWPDASNGIAIQLAPGSFDDVSNNSASSWCVASNLYNSDGGDDSFGTPGTANDPCP
ncbi:MAG: lamin tail domain-containing protein, partial [Myxococcota bacterium]